MRRHKLVQCYKIFSVFFQNSNFCNRTFYNFLLLFITINLLLLFFIRSKYACAPYKIFLLFVHSLEYSHIYLHYCVSNFIIYAQAKQEEFNNILGKKHVYFLCYIYQSTISQFVSFNRFYI